MRNRSKFVLVGVGAVALAAPLVPMQASAVAPPAVAIAPTLTDPITRCQDDYDSGVVGNTPIAFGMLQNEIPRGITVSKWVPGDPVSSNRKKVGTIYGKGRIVTPEAPEVWLGQRTPYLEGGSVIDAKQLTSGARFYTDHWFGTMDNVGCQTNIPYAVGPGKSDVARAIAYDGGAFRSSGVEKWWGIPKEYSREGAAGYVKFTCRGEPNATGDSGYYWKKINSGYGFKGALDSKGVDSEAGRAPACQDGVFKDSRVRHFWDMTYYGNSEPRTNRGCSTASDYNTLGCYQLMYQGPWKRSIRFETHAWAPALRAKLSSTATILIPPRYSSDPVQRAVTRKLSWRITDARISGSWPSGYRESRFTKPATLESFKTLSPYTVPGTGENFLLSGWGSVVNPDEFMVFRLTADTDGTWVWPTDPDTGEAMERPAVVIRVGYTLGNFDSNSGSCTAGEYWNDLKPSRNDACIQGFVPTTWGVPTGQSDRERRVFNFKTDGKDNASTATFQSTAITGNWMDSELKVQNVSTDAPATVSANVGWEIRLSGQIDGRDL